tara:strand:+ start:185 stop:556 length:372 start_codon:yes stop_codon:yes gene_type:complete
MDNNSVMNPLDPRNMKNGGFNSSEDKLKVLIKEVKNLREINSNQKQELDDMESSSSKKMKIGSLGVLITLGMLCALSVHESSKYFMLKAMKLHGYTSNIYIIYPLVIIILCVFVFMKVMNHIN